MNTERPVRLPGMPHNDLLEAAMTLFTEKYIFPDKAATAAADIRARLAAGEFDGLDEADLSDQITDALDKHCGDKHLRLRPGSAAASGSDTPTTEDATRAWEAKCERSNHGVHRVERLPGSIGLIDLRLVTSPLGAQTIAAAMTMVATTQALIIDNRNNRGGDPLGVQLWHSYLFPDAETHLNDIYDGNTGTTRQYWTLPHVAGPRYVDKPVWVLTSGTTFSAGEEFSYNLKNLGRATLVGETTRGGAHPTEVFPLTPTMEITVPIARSINPITGTNWEGTGVEPDIAVPAEEAFDLAYKQALEHVVNLDVHTSILDEAKTALAERG